MTGIWLAASALPIRAAGTFDGDQIKVSLLSESSALAPGKTAWLGLRLQHAPQWHTYWINPGDSGLPTRLAWSLPAGFKAGAIAWPVPKRFNVDDLTNFGYDGDTLLPVPIEVPADAAIGTRAHLQVEAKWLVCHEECIPGKTTLALDLPVATETPPDSRWNARFAAARDAQPRISHLHGSARVIGDRIEVTLRGPNLPKAMMTDVFPEQTKLVAYAAPSTEVKGDALVVGFKKSDYFTSIPTTFDLVLVETANESGTAQRISARFELQKHLDANPASTQP